MKKFVWDTSAIINIKEPNEAGYSPGHSLIKDLSEGYIGYTYQNIFPVIAIFEINATVSKLERKGKPILREFYLIDKNSLRYDVDWKLVKEAHKLSLFTLEGFKNLYGADLIFASIAYIEKAYLVTKDKKLAQHASKHIKVIDLNDSLNYTNYRNRLNEDRK